MCLEKRIDHFAAVVNRPPQVLLFAAYLHKNFVDVSMAEVESMIEPDGIMNDFKGEPLVFV